MFLSKRRFEVSWIILLLMPPSTAWAGWGYSWPDLTSTSPDGRYVLDAIRKTEKAPIHFAYRLRDRAGKTLWQQNERIGEGWPSAVFVADDAWSVLWLWQDEGKLLVVRPDGTPEAKLDILGDLLTDEEREMRVIPSFSSGGAKFGNRYCYTVSDQGISYFVMRTYWDRRVVVDLRQGRPIKAPAALDAVMDSAERKHVVSELRLASDAKYLEDIKWSQTESLYMAIHMAGRLKGRESIPLLRAIEADPYVNDSDPADEFAEGGRPTEYRWQEHGFRRAAQIALRRIGEKLRPLPGMTLEVQVVDADMSWLKMPSKPREQQVGEVRTGLTPREVIRLLGPPDYANSREQWRYDMDTERPFTLILLWQHGQVKRIITETPPVWQTEVRCAGGYHSGWMYANGTQE